MSPEITSIAFAMSFATNGKPLVFKVTEVGVNNQPLHSSLQSTDTIPSNAFTDKPPALVQPRHRFYNVDTSEESEAMETVIRKWGNSPALRLPTALLKEAGYQLEQKVDLVVSRGRIIIQPSKKIEYDLDTLVNGIHAGNTHDEVNFGRPVGNEAL